jgi:hypothetical protein
MTDLDREMIHDFANRGGVKYQAAKAAIRRLLNSDLRPSDIERLREFIDDNVRRYPDTCQALKRVLGGGNTLE